MPYGFVCKAMVLDLATRRSQCILPVSDLQFISVDDSSLVSIRYYDDIHD